MGFRKRNANKSDNCSKSKVVMGKPASQLTKEDKKILSARMAEIKSANGGKTTVQNTIPYMCMYKDGVCQVSENFFSMTVQFYDANYSISEFEEQNNIFSKYCDVINLFDNTIKFQLAQQILDFRIAETRYQRIYASVLKLLDDVSQLSVIPLALYLVHCNAQGFFFFWREVNNNDLGFLNTACEHYVQSLVSADKRSRALVHDERNYKTELINTRFQRLVLEVSLRQLNPRIVVRWCDVSQLHSFGFQMYSLLFCITKDGWFPSPSV